ncbi:MAG TPA: biotin/lipoyl-binding protein, partial [Fimbriimonas sp.]|nr:biotin/lipoyl-binding protein [Fimbriimonas sp.]
MVHEPLPKTKEEPTPLPIHPPTAEPSDGGYKKRHIPWGWIIGGCAALSIVASVINGRLHAVAELPEGLIAVNGGFEGDHVIVSSKYSGRIASLLAREGASVTKGQLLVRVDD